MTDIRPLIVFACFYLLYVSASLGDMSDPVVTFVLFPIAALYLAFLECSEWMRANAEA